MIDARYKDVFDDLDPLRDHVAVIRRLAAGCSGKLIAASYGENPETGEKLTPKVQHFQIGDVDGMTAAVRELAGEKHRNVYMPLCVMRRDLPDRDKGGEADIAAVLGIVGDFDDADAAEYRRRLPIAPNYALETSTGRFQAFYLFTRPLPMTEAKNLGERLKLHARCDHGTADMSHVWRIPGLLNWPSEKKLKQGRPPEPQQVRVAQPWDGSMTDPADLDRALPQLHVAAPAAEIVTSAAPIDLASLSEDLRRLIVDGAPQGERSDKFHSVVTSLTEAGHSADAIHDLLAQHPGGIAAKYRGRLRKAVADSARKATRKAPQEEFTAIGRPTIKIAAGELHNLATAGEQALIAAGEPLYVRGPQVVRPVIDDAEAAHGQRTKVVRLTAVTPSVLIDRLNRVAKWTKYHAREKKELPADPPRIVAETILSRDGEWKFPHLAGVITTPTLRPDGSLLAAPGYDRQTRLLLIDPPAMPDIPSKPTQAHARAALALLDGLLSEFPFVDDASRSVGLSALISPVVRGAMAAVPMHMWRAPTAGSSKSFGVDVASTIATGQRCPVISAGANEEELEKRLGAAVMTGQPIVCVDNVNGELGGDALCQLIERPAVDIRILGRSEMVRVENRATIYATGNNVCVVGDMVRRVLVASLDANMERPELRRFTQDPLALILADRGKYVAACLTVVLAYIEAGCPAPQAALASFGDWSRLVRSALVWLGRADPLLTMETARAEDPEIAALQQVVTAWRDAIGVDTPLFAGQLAEHADPAMREALQVVAGTRRQGFVGTDTRALGRWLANRKGRITQGLKIMGHRDSDTKQQKWWLRSMEPRQ